MYRPKNENLSGRKFGKLSTIERVGTSKWGSSLWRCLCDCGKEIITDRHYLFRKPNPLRDCGCEYNRKKLEKIRRDLTGQKFGRWLVLKLDAKTDAQGRRFWLCRCDCGTEKVVGSHHLYSNKSQSCGCYNNEIRHQTYLPAGESAFRRLFHRYKNGAKHRNLSFLLTEGEFRNLVTGNCFYCGGHPSTIVKEKASDFIYNGIDRIDNEMGYEKSNSVSCCKICNKMKYTLDKNEFIEHCYRIYQNFKFKPH